MKQQHNHNRCAPLQRSGLLWPCCPWGTERAHLCHWLMEMFFTNEILPRWSARGRSRWSELRERLDGGRPSGVRGAPIRSVCPLLCTTSFGPPPLLDRPGQSRGQTFGWLHMLADDLHVRHFPLRTRTPERCCCRLRRVRRLLSTVASLRHGVCSIVRSECERELQVGVSKQC